MKPVLSLAIITYNKQSRLRIMLESLKKIQFDQKYEIVIIDNGSTDDTEALLQEFSLYCRKNQIHYRTIRYEQKGRSFARNCAIENTSGDVIIFCDDDLILNKNFLSAHYQMHKQQSNLVVHGRIETLVEQKFFSNPLTGELQNGQNLRNGLRRAILKLEMIQDGTIDNYLLKHARLIQFERDIRELYSNTSRKESFVRWIGFTGGNVSVRKEYLNRVGGYDTNLGIGWGCEDLELGYRLYLDGLEFTYCDAAVNYHISHYSAGRDEEHRKALAYCIEKHNSKEFALLEYYFEKLYENLIEWYDAVKSERGIYDDKM